MSALITFYEFNAHKKFIKLSFNFIRTLIKID